jgi:hypothetical protein
MSHPVRGQRVVPQRRHYYCALIGCAFEGMFKKDTYVFVAHDPVRSTILFNTEAVVNKDTSSVAPHWKLHGAVGPFENQESAVACAQELADSTRTRKSKRMRLRELASRFGVACYTDAVQAPGGTRAYLEKHAPPAFLRVFHQLCRPS